MIPRWAALVLAGTLLGACAAVPPPPAAPAAISAVPLDPLPATSAGARSWTPWPAAQHDARHSGASSTDGPTTGAVRWRRDLGAGLTSGPVVGQDGTVYQSGNDGVLHALDPANGADRWTVDVGGGSGGDLSTSPLVLPGGTILVGAGRELVAVSAAGVIAWRQALPGSPTSPATVDGARVYVGDRSGNVTAVDVADGAHRLAWTIPVGPSSYGSVVTGGGGRLYTTSGSSLVAVDDHGATATLAWTADPGDDITEVSAGLGPDGTALLGTNGRQEWAYHPDGTPAWISPRVITYSSPSVTADGLAYVADHSGRVQVLDVSGIRRATYQLDPPQQIWTAVAVDRAHRLYFGTLDGRVVGIAADGTLLFDLALGSSVYAYPALTGDGALVVGSRDGVLTAVG